MGAHTNRPGRIPRGLVHYRGGVRSSPAGVGSSRVRKICLTGLGEVLPSDEAPPALGMSLGDPTGQRLPSLRDVNRHPEFVRQCPHQLGDATVSERRFVSGWPKPAWTARRRKPCWLTACAAPRART